MQLNQNIFDALMTAKITIEDLIEMEARGKPSGFKPKALKRQLATLDQAISQLTKKGAGECQ